MAMFSELNRTISSIFKQMSVMYEYIGEKEHFRSLAYFKASRVIDSLSDDLSDFMKHHSLEELPGIGKGIANRIKEYISTGHIKVYDNLKKKTPNELLELTAVRGFGPRSLRLINKKLGINTKNEFAKALIDGRIAKLKGFGPKKVENYLKSLKLYQSSEHRLTLYEASEIGAKIKAECLKYPGAIKVELAGSIRRQKETIGDLDILIACEMNSRKKIIDLFTQSKIVGKILSKGETKCTILMANNGIQVDMRLINEDDWGTALQYFTGSKEHNIHLRTIANKNGFKLSEYGLFNLLTGKKLSCKDEADIYRNLKLPFIVPEMREDRGEIELKLNGKTPKLIALSDIKGDLQIHSKYSDGLASIEDLYDYLQINFNYQYIAITDHSKASTVTKGLDEKQILEQIKRISDINTRNGNSFIKAGIEVDILADGRLDISNEVLSQLDWVTASIHSNFNKNNTDRLISACNNPNVNCIGHPTSRLIGNREPYALNIDSFFEAAKATRTALEINAQPLRMDLNDTNTKLAIEKGVKLVISTDSHSLKDLSYMRYGVAIARRAWCEKKDILNTKMWNEIVGYKKGSVSTRTNL